MRLPLSRIKIKVPVNIQKEDSYGRKITVPNPEYLQIKSEYIKLISTVPNENSQEEFIGGMPIQLEKGCLKQLIKLKTYVMTLKVDGERYLLFLASNGFIYLIDRSTNFYFFIDNNGEGRLRPLNMKPFLFDGELVEHKSHYEYLVFDCLFYDNKSFISEPYNVRYDVCKFSYKKVFKNYFKHATNQIILTVKIWYPLYAIMSSANVYDYIAKETNKNRDKNTKLKADGLILQPFDTPYVPFGPWNKYNNVQFKWKPSNELTIDFKIKIISKNEWHLATKTDQPYMINQIEGNPLPATCIPSDLHKEKYHENEVVEFKFKETGNPNGILFVPVRSRNEKDANSLSTIKSTMCVINDPFSLELLKPAIKFLNTNMEKINKDFLSIFSVSDLILCIVDNFFTIGEQKEMKKVYNSFIENAKLGPIELECRFSKHGKSGKGVDKFTFYYLQDYLKNHFKFDLIETIDIIQNKPNQYKADSISGKGRSTYKNLIKDIYDKKSISNDYKEKIKSYTLEPTDAKQKLYNNLVFKLELAKEIPTDKVIGLKSIYAGKTTNNLIRFKERYSFKINQLWRIDLTKVVSAYSLETLKDKNETFECECEFIGDADVPFETFVKSLSNLFKLIASNSNYCDTCF
jgi:hypothetical protein